MARIASDSANAHGSMQAGRRRSKLSPHLCIGIASIGTSATPRLVIRANVHHPRRPRGAQHTVEIKRKDGRNGSVHAQSPRQASVAQSLDGLGRLTGSLRSPVLRRYTGSGLNRKVPAWTAAPMLGLARERNATSTPPHERPNGCRRACDRRRSVVRHPERPARRWRSATPRLRSTGFAISPRPAAS
jgi:hypothetical protein